VTTAGRVELLPFLREQSVSITAHRFGTPDHLTDAIL
jgi:RHH-type transcriptional regulator, proline utilization regulon repressor / proline dehydrogenase / delta 1-pyrroline-5-carboxylate dehydrogenase